MRRHRLVLWTILVLAAASSTAQDAKLILLGTGNPVPDPDRSGPSVAVVVDDEAYLVDLGPGVVRRADAAAQKHQLRALLAANLRTAFITHLHSDHTLGYPDLIFTTWVMGRSERLKVYGPPGLKAMTDHLVAAYAQDIDMRTNGLEHASPDGYKVDAVEIQPGVIHEDARVKVTAFAVPHGTWDHAFGYRFDAAGRVIVISGDTAPSEALVEQAKGCDILVHEVYSEAALKQLPAGGQAYHSTFHTSGVELGKIAARAKPKLLVLYHNLSWSPEDQVIAEIRQNYGGPLVAGKDLDAF